ncbi:FAD/NAD(P)-binding oxidoreductase [Nocardioides zeae]|uniref:FAD/NAD(P)-binding oxidoreductase n=1 Tax=Nocardioides imazamoxiresistens TaxID=3231893 RepID=A0ABU3Q0V3_9ACTN|nr:FAD/NAD(P)-binding oxidoreductase [Nocardioides zeae]MDT9595066.1 FAD/NAD(P)-binding oxidoreductase [Nocardioides zeae]
MSRARIVETTPEGTVDLFDVVIVGGGNAGISLAARLRRDGVRDVALVEPRAVHHYRPLLNYVGAGLASMGALERPTRRLVPDGVTLVEDRVVAVDPGGDAGAGGPAVTTAGGRTLRGRDLVLCPGLEEDWDATPGLASACAAGWAASTFVGEHAPRVWPALRDLTSGRVLFTVPPEPAPCGPTALKPLLMACDHWRRRGVLGRLEVTLVLPYADALGVTGPDRRVEEALRSAGVRVLRGSQVRALGGDAGGGEARRVEVGTPDGPAALDDLAFAHVVPHYRAPRWIGAAGLAGATAAGLVDVDPHTLRHPRHPAVWAIGDVADLRTRPSGGALRRQVAVLAANLAAVRATDGSAASPRLEEYDGYTVMPITLDRRRLMLVEIDREGRPAPTVPFPDLFRPRRSTWLADRYGLPVTYFRRILRGRV